MASSVAGLNQQVVSRRSFLKGALCGAGGLALYAGEFERHWLEVVKKDIGLRGLSAEFDGLTIAQLSDIHLDEFTEPFLLREAIDAINQARPDLVLLTGDYVSAQVLPPKLTVDAAWQCGKMLGSLQCRQRYAIFGNHDVWAGEQDVGEALKFHGTTVLRNSYVPIERGGSRLWLAGLDDPCCGQPDPDHAIPSLIRNVANESIILMCHAPDYVDQLRLHPAGQAASLVLSGHTHGGQVRLPIVGPLWLPPGGCKDVEGLFQLGTTQLYVNRGIGTVGAPFRFNCRPEITLFTLRSI
ncbi:MAG: metallophosphoesterase [Terracidiphilus sp.]